MPAWLASMRLIFNPIFKWIGSAWRRVQSRLVLRLVTIAAFDREDTLPVGAAPQAEERVGTTIITPQGRITRRVAIDAARMHEDRVRFQKSGQRARIIA
jgi:hypothetical protein